ncbi:MAG: hypothetical protein Q9220_006911 [cf. Caloplaca sp. 1 TL-2023]
MADIQLNDRQQEYISAYCMHLPGITPWAVAAFLRHTFPGDSRISTITAAEVCKLYYFRRSSDVDRWTYRFKELVAELHEFLNHLPEQFSMIRLVHDDVGTIWNQMVANRLNSPDRVTSLLQDRNAITKENTLIQAEDAEANRQQLDHLLQDAIYNEEAFLAFLCLWPDGSTTVGFQGPVGCRMVPITAFKIALIRNVLHLGEEVIWSDVNVYSFVLSLFYDNRQEKLKYRGWRRLMSVEDIERLPLAQQEEINLYTKLYNVITHEIELHIEVRPDYAPLKDLRNGLCTHHWDLLRQLDALHDTIIYPGNSGRQSISEQMQSRGMFRQNYRPVDTDMALLGPVAVQRSACNYVIHSIHRY